MSKYKGLVIIFGGAVLMIIGAFSTPPMSFEFLLVGGVLLATVGIVGVFRK